MADECFKGVFIKVAEEVPDFAVDHFKACTEIYEIDVIQPMKQKELCLFNHTLPLLRKGE